MEARFQMLDNHLLKTCGDEPITYDGQEMTVRQLIANAKEKRKDIYLIVEKFISPKAQDNRHSYIKSATSRLYQTFWDASFKDFALGNNKFTRREMWQTFIAAEQMKNFKIGDFYQINGKLRAPFKVTNPSQFDYGKYLRNFNAFSLFYSTYDKILLDQLL